MGITLGLYRGYIGNYIGNYGNHQGMRHIVLKADIFQAVAIHVSRDTFEKPVCEFQACQIPRHCIHCSILAARVCPKGV